MHRAACRRRRFASHVVLAAVAVFATLATVTTAPASAVLVYERSKNPDYPPREIVAARNDGSAPRIIARGDGPQVSPSGHRVAYFASSDGEDLYVVGIRGRH